MAEKKTEKTPETKRKNGVNVEALLAARGSAEEGAAGGEIQVACVLQLEERHAQPHQGQGLPWAHGGAEPQDRVLVRRGPS